MNEHSSLGRRAVALLLDWLILILPVAIVGNAIPVLGGLLVWFFYAPILECSDLRATIGKHLMGIQVTGLGGEQLTFKQSILRNLLKIVSGAMALIGYLFAFFTERKQTLHDLLAETVVVYGRSERSIPEAWAESIKKLFR